MSSVKSIIYRGAFYAVSGAAAYTIGTLLAYTGLYAACKYQERRREDKYKRIAFARKVLQDDWYE